MNSGRTKCQKKLLKNERLNTFNLLYTLHFQLYTFTIADEYCQNILHLKNYIYHLMQIR